MPEPTPLSRHAFNAELRDGAQLKVNRDTVEWLVGVEIVYRKFGAESVGGLEGEGGRQAASITLM